MLRIVHDIPENIDGGVGLDGYARQHFLFMHVVDHLFWAGLGLGLIGRVLGGCGGDGGFVMEAIEVASSLLKVLYPFLGLSVRLQVSQRFSLLC